VTSNIELSYRKYIDSGAILGASASHHLVQPNANAFGSVLKVHFERFDLMQWPYYSLALTGPPRLL